MATEKAMCLQECWQRGDHESTIFCADCEAPMQAVRSKCARKDGYSA
jgi:hypothetical protein